jgi:uncharacterized OB-fold protein
MADAPTTPEVPFRILPRLTDLNRDFWTGGKVGELRFQRCQQCGYYNHPATPLCPMCHAKALEYEAVSGRATLWTYTVNYQAWMPGPELPFVVAIVAIPEQAGLRLTTNLVDVEPEDLEIGMELEVVFENHDDDVWIPLFRPVEGV